MPPNDQFHLSYLKHKTINGLDLKGNDLQWHHIPRFKTGAQRE